MQKPFLSKLELDETFSDVAYSQISMVIVNKKMVTRGAMALRYFLYPDASKMLLEKQSRFLR